MKFRDMVNRLTATLICCAFVSTHVISCGHKQLTVDSRVWDENSAAGDSGDDQSGNGEGSYTDDSGGSSVETPGAQGSVSNGTDSNGTPVTIIDFEFSAGRDSRQSPDPQQREQANREIDAEIERVRKGESAGNLSKGVGADPEKRSHLVKEAVEAVNRRIEGSGLAKINYKSDPAGSDSNASQAGSAEADIAKLQKQLEEFLLPILWGMFQN